MLNLGVVRFSMIDICLEIKLKLNKVSEMVLLKIIIVNYNSKS